MYTVDFADTTGTSTIEFNLCEETVRRCPDLMPDHANIINGVGTCNHLSKVVQDGEQKPGTMSLISESNPGLGVVMNYEGGNMCNEESHFSLQVQINCNPNLEKTTYALDKASLQTPCDPRVIMNSPHACPVATAGALSTVISDWKYLIGAPAILLGAYFAFTGGKYTGVTLFIFCSVAIFLAGMISVFTIVLPPMIPQWTVLVVGFVCLGMGLGMGYGALRWPKIGLVIMGLSLGALFGLFLYWAFIGSAVESSLAKALTIVGIALMSAILWITISDHMVIVASAIFGSYLFIRGITCYTGGYVDELTLILASQNSDLSELKWTMILFWILMGLMALASINIQFKSRAEHLKSGILNTASQNDSIDAMRERYQRFGNRFDDSDVNKYSDDDQEPLKQR